MKPPTPPSCLLLAATLLCLGAPSFAQEEPPPTEQDPPPGPPAPPRGGADPSDDAFEMGSPPSLAQGVSEEQMWPAATVEGWKMPVLVQWQRSFDDALRVARADHRPILVAVNMDGEIASEHFAGVRYRDAETAALMTRYACVVASVYRHTPRDYDEEGRRVECPRFGTVTCGEHIQAERELYEKYFDGVRVAPRHIVLDLDGTETYDVYYSWDTATVFTTFRKGVESWPEPNEAMEPTLHNLATSANVEYREALEQEYLQGEIETKRTILRLLIEQRQVDQVEVLRTAIFGLDLELAELARHALAKCETEGSLDLMAEALKIPLEASDRELLLGAVARMAETSPRARTLQALHSGLSLDSRHIDGRSAEALAREYEANAGRRVDVQARAEAVEARPEEPGALLELAEAMLARAQETPDQRFARFLIEDAHSAALEAERLGSAGPRLDGVVAVTAAELGDRTVARNRAVDAVEGGLLRLDDAATPGEAEPGGTLTGPSRRSLLLLFAEARRRAIRSAYRAGDTWPPEWLSDVNAAYSIIAESSLVDPAPLVEYYDFLRWIGATPRANAVLDDALRRFPDSPVLHDRLRIRLLWEGGREGLERGYEERLASEEAAGNGPTQLTWFAGYASLVAAEHHRRRNEFEAAVTSYGRAIGHFERNIELFPDGKDVCDHYIALAHAGGARVAHAQGQLDLSMQGMLTALRLRPASAATMDGLGITPIATARMLMARLLESGVAEGAARVQTTLDALDPALLEPPPSERAGSRRRGPRGGGRRGQGGGGGGME